MDIQIHAKARGIPAAVKRIRILHRMHHSANLIYHYHIDNGLLPHPHMKTDYICIYIYNICTSVSKIILIEYITAKLKKKKV